MCNCFVFLCKPQLGILTHPVTTVYIVYFCFILRCTHVCGSAQTLYSSKYYFFFGLAHASMCRVAIVSFLIKMITISYTEISYLCVMDFRKLVCLSVTIFSNGWNFYLSTQQSQSVYICIVVISYTVNFCEAEIFAFEHPSRKNFFLRKFVSDMLEKSEHIAVEPRVQRQRIDPLVNKHRAKCEIFFWKATYDQLAFCHCNCVWIFKFGV